LAPTTSRSSNFPRKGGTSRHARQRARAVCNDGLQPYREQWSLPSFPAGTGQEESVDLTDHAWPEEVIMAASADSLHGYHVHIYYKDETLAAAQSLRDRLAASFPVQLGKNAGIAGPHPVPQIQIIFKKEAFQQVVPWLMLNRNGLDILVHPLSDNEYDDHTDYALWMGTAIKLKVETLPHGPYPARLLPAG
jgi:aromatic ring-cleaving dioxygenase